MTSWYLDKLYPLQDKVLNLISQQVGDFPLYLTGGTCLSRIYYHHRYSDDLDLFYHDTQVGQPLINNIIKTLGDTFKIDIVLQTNDLTSIMVNDILKIDLVRDVGQHWGEFIKHLIYPYIDNPKNVLANKIGAIMDRDEAKDVADFWVITQKETINWPEIFSGAATKAAGILPPLVAQRLHEFPIEWLDKIQWTDPLPDKQQIKADLETTINQMLSG